MAIEQSIRKILADDSTVAGLVSSRIYPQVIPQGASMPAITYQQVSCNREFNHDGPADFADFRFQINCWSNTYTQSRSLADAVRAALNGASGKKATGTNSDQHHFFIVILQGEVDLFDYLPDVKDSRRFAKALDFNIWAKEAIE